ncbi:MAG: hypothetical protein ABEH81_04005 [Halopenitus sp.]
MTNPIAHPELIIEGDPDGEGLREATFVFAAGDESEGGLSEDFNLRTGYVTEGVGKILQTLLSEFDSDFGGPNKGLFINLGSGQMTWTINFSSWEGSPYQWGDTGDASTVTKTDATGADATTQRDVLAYWLRNTRVDSLPEGIPGSDAAIGTLHIGDYHPGGMYEPLRVVFEEPSLSRSGPSTLTGNITFIEAADLRSSDNAEGRVG